MPAATIYDQLVGYWKFDTLDVSSKVPDSSNQGSAGTLVSASLTSGSMRTSASTGYMTMPDALVQRQSPTNRVSVNIWINLDKALNTMWGTPKFLDKTGGGTSGYFLGVLPSGGNVVSFQVFNSAGTPYTAAYTESATSGWVMITGVYEGANVRIYRNGVSQNTAVADGSLRFAVTDITNVGLGFEGLIDELSVWTRMLTGSDVTTLYASGNKLNLIFPESFTSASTAFVYPRATSGYTSGADTFDTVSAPLDVLGVSIGTDVRIPMLKTLIYADKPYSIRDDPRRVYVDPLPAITSLVIDSNHHVIGQAVAGPTDAYQTYNYWEIELEPGVSIVVVDQAVSTNFFANRATQTDTWDVPEGSSWQGKRARFVIQAVQDSSQTWASPWQDLTEEPWNNAECPYPAPATYSDPVPQIVSVSVTPDRLVTASAAAGPTEAVGVLYRWEIELPDGSVLAIADETIDTVFSTRETVTSTFAVPDGQLWNGMRVRFAVRNEDSAKRHVPQVWYSSWYTLNDSNFDNSAAPTLPDPPIWPYAVNPASDLSQISPASVDLYDISRHTLTRASDLQPLALGLAITVDVPTNTAEPILLLEKATAGLYSLRYVSGSRRDEATLKYNKFFPGAWGTYSKGLWIQSQQHKPYYVFQSPAFTTSGYDSAVAASSAAANQEFIFFHKGGDLKVRWDIDPALVSDMSGTITLQLSDVAAEYIPGRWEIISSDAGTPILSNSGAPMPTVANLGAGLTTLRYFVASGDSKPRWQTFFIRVWGVDNTNAVTQNPTAVPSDVQGSGFSVRQRSPLASKPAQDGNAGATTADTTGE